MYNKLPFRCDLNKKEEGIIPQPSFAMLMQIFTVSML